MGYYLILRPGLGLGDGHDHACYRHIRNSQLIILLAAEVSSLNFKFQFSNFERGLAVNLALTDGRNSKLNNHIILSFLFKTVNDSTA